MASMQHENPESGRPGTLRIRLARLLGHDAVLGFGALLATLALLTLVVPPAWMMAPREDPVARAAPRLGAEVYLLARHGEEVPVARMVGERLRGDLEALERFRPGYRFWQHVFSVPDGSVIFGDASDGRLLAVFPARGDWQDGARWEDPSLAPILWDRSLATDAARRRDQVAELLRGPVGPALHNGTRGDFVQRNVPRYGGFLEEWGRIYERFGVPAEIGLAQAMVESGLNGTIRSEAGAIGLCQWLRGNWNRMNQLSPHEIEGHNQTTQAPYCAAYLTVLATKYGSFIPALSEHHAGGTNVGRTLINGARLGAKTPREQYLIGSELARDLRDLSRIRYRDVVRSYGPRSYLYAEMVFGTAANVDRIRDEVPQERIHAMRAGRPIPLSEVRERTGLGTDEIRRFNPALIRRVPAGATLFLPFQVEDFGPDVAFWHRPANPGFTIVLADFLGLDATVEEWEDPAFGVVLDEFRRRFAATGTEEGDVMATVLAYAAEEAYLSRRPEILAEFRVDPRIHRLVLEGVEARRGPGTSTGAPASVTIQ
jgi:hypothetical protein